MSASSDPPQITEQLIRRLASGESFQRGKEYFRGGAVTNLTRRGERLLAEVEGSSYEPYRVDVSFDAGGIASAECTCPYDWGGACKHIVAALLAYINEPERVEERPPLDTLLADLSSEQLRDILSSLAEQQPGLADVIEAQVLALQARARTAEQPALTDGNSPRQRQTRVDPASFQRQVCSILHSLDHMRMSEAYWHVGSIVKSVRQVAEQARPFIEAGDGRSALAVLQGVTEAYIADWTNLDDSNGELGAYFEELGELWTEAILTADLTFEERKSWAQRFRRWQREVGEYGIDEAFQPAATAAEQGWDYPPLQLILRGEFDEREGEKDAQYELVEMVVDGALKAGSHHEWVIEACRRQADEIIEGGKSQLYEAAARWLDKARVASVGAGREAEWRAYVEEIIARHKRKYRLVPLLEAMLKRG